MTIFLPQGKVGKVRKFDAEGISKQLLKIIYFHLSFLRFLPPKYSTSSTQKHIYEY